jgi:hypothetical protein
VIRGSLPALSLLLIFSIPSRRDNCSQEHCR